jgi:transcription elongation GreA/GreB family factor
MERQAQPSYFSREGLDFFRARLTVIDKRAFNAGQEAGDAACGDSNAWHDNAEYETAIRDLQNESERIRKILHEAGNVQLIEVEEQDERAAIGSTVVIEREDGSSMTFTIGAYGENSLEDNLFTYQSPIARAVISKEVGDEGILRLPKKRPEIVEITELHPASHRYRELIRKLFTKVEA